MKFRRSFFGHTAQKLKCSIKDFFGKCNQIRRKLRIWSHLHKKSLMENFNFCGMSNKRCKTKHGTLRNNYKSKGLKNADTELTIIWLKCSWIHITSSIMIRK